MNQGAQTTLASFGSRPMMTTQFCILTRLPGNLGSARKRTGVDIEEMGYFGWGRTKELDLGIYGEEILDVYVLPEVES